APEQRDAADHAGAGERVVGTRRRASKAPRILRERLNAVSRVLVSNVYPLCVVALASLLALWAITGESRIIWYGTHPVMWAAINESARRAPARRLRAAKA